MTMLRNPDDVVSCAPLVVVSEWCLRSGVYKGKEEWCLRSDEGTKKKKKKKGRKKGYEGAVMNTPTL